MNSVYIVSGMATAIVAMAGFIVWLVKMLLKIAKDSVRVNSELKSSLDNNTKVTDRVFDHLISSSRGN